MSGEEIITRIIQSLPKYLRPGGEFFVLLLPQSPIRSGLSKGSEMAWGFGE